MTLKSIPTCVLIWHTQLQSLMLIDQRKPVIMKKNPNVWLKTTIFFSKLTRILQSNWPQKQFPHVSWYALPTCKVECWLFEWNSSYCKKINVWRLPDHRHPQSSNLVSPCEKLVKNKKYKAISCSINKLFYCSRILVGGIGPMIGVPESAMDQLITKVLTSYKGKSAPWWWCSVGIPSHAFTYVMPRPVKVKIFSLHEITRNVINTVLCTPNTQDNSKSTHKSFRLRLSASSVKTSRWCCTGTLCETVIM